MPKYIVNCSSEWCGVDDTYIVTAKSEIDAYDIALAEWQDVCALGVDVEKEIDPKDSEEWEGYKEIE